MTIEQLKCPHCGSERVAQGDILPFTAIDRHVVFRPRDRRWWSFVLPDAKVSTDGCACTDCGVLWTSVDLGRLNRVIAP